jgi:hypothetical protein
VICKAVTREQIEMALRLFLAFTIFLSVIVDIASAQSTGWVLWIREETTVDYVNGRTKRTDSWNISDSFEGFKQCKAAATEKIVEALKSYKESAKGPYFDNAAVSLHRYRQYNEEEQQKTYESLLSTMKSSKEATEVIKREGPILRNWGFLKYICLPGGTDPRPREKDS